MDVRSQSQSTLTFFFLTNVDCNLLLNDGTQLQQFQKVILGIPALRTVNNPSVTVIRQMVRGQVARHEIQRSNVINLC